MSKRATCSGSSYNQLCTTIIMGISSSFSTTSSYYTNSTYIKNSSSFRPYSRVDTNAVAYGIATACGPGSGSGTWTCDYIVTGSMSQNSYSYVGMVSSSNCSGSVKDSGYKAVQSRKQWHGREGFLCPEHNVTSSDLCNAISVRYLTVNRYSRYKKGYTTAGPYTTGSTTIVGDFSATRQYYVDRYTGNIYLGSCSNTNHVGTASAADLAILTNTYRGITMAAGCFDSASIAAYNYNNSLPEYGYIDEQRCVVTDTDVELSWSNNESNDYQNISTSIKLSGSYSYTDVYNDAASLLSYISLNDDDANQNPFSREAYKSFGPLLTLDEAPGPANPDQLYTDCTMDNGAGGTDIWWYTGYTSGSRNCVYSGDILGRLFPKASGSCNKGFDWRNVTYRYTTIDSGATYGWFPTYYGCYSTEYACNGGATYNGLPTLAKSSWTQWPSNYDACYQPAYAYWIFPAGCGSIQLQKFSEIKENIESFNHIRPCESDRFTGDLLTSSAILDYGSIFPLLDLDADLSADIPVGSYVYVNSSSKSMICQVDNYPSAGQMEVTVIYDDEYLWYGARINQERVCKLKFFPDRSRNLGLCGPVPLLSITAPADGHMITGSFNKIHYLIDGDVCYVDRLGQHGLAAGYYPVSRINSSSIGFNTTHYTASNVTGFPNPYIIHSSSLGVNTDTLNGYNDNESKGDIVWITKQPCSASNDNGDCECGHRGTEDSIYYRFDLTSSAVQDCVKMNPCKSVFECTPNGDYHNGSTRRTFPTVSSAPSSCGSAYVIHAQQHMLDPYTQNHWDTLTPVSPACAYYVEPRITTASGMPVTASTCTFWLEWDHAGQPPNRLNSMPNAGFYLPLPWALADCSSAPQPI